MLCDHFVHISTRFHQVTERGEHLKGPNVSRYHNIVIYRDILHSEL